MNIPPDPTLAPPRIEDWLARHARRVVAALALAAVLVRAVVALQLAGGPVARIPHAVPPSDCAFFDQWAQQIAAGDWLQREPLHPMTPWMSFVAREALRSDPGLAARLGLPAGAEPAALENGAWDRWLGGATFYQEPAYPYLVGLTYAAAGPRPWAVFGWQLVLGVAGVLLVHALARRLFSHTAAAAAGVLAVLAPLPLFFEFTLLRDGPVAVATLALALTATWAVQGRLARWLVFGMVVGAAALLKQSLLAFPVAVAVARLLTSRSRPATPWRERVAAAALVAAGAALAVAPAVARNLAVGVSPFAFNGSAAGMLALYHGAAATPLSAPVGPELVPVYVKAGGRLVASLVEAARTHPSLGDFLLLQAGKLAYAFHGYESPNNVDFYVFRHGSSVLAALPATFVLLLPLAVLGLVGRAERAWPILAAIAACLPALILSAVLSRYRAQLTAALLPAAGAGLVRAAAWAAARRWRPLALMAVLAAGYAVWATRRPPGMEDAVSGPVYVDMGRGLVKRGEPALAALYFREALSRAPGDPRTEAWLGVALLGSGDLAAAGEVLERAAPRLVELARTDAEARALAEILRRALAAGDGRRVTP